MDFIPEEKLLPTRELLCLPALGSRCHTENCPRKSSASWSLLALYNREWYKHLKKGTWILLICKTLRPHIRVPQQREDSISICQTSIIIERWKALVPPIPIWDNPVDIFILFCNSLKCLERSNYQLA